QHLKLGSGQFIEAGNEIHYYAGEKVTIDAGQELTLKAGGSFVRLDGGGVTFSGATVRTNSGGSPGTGTPAAPLLPGPQQQVDQSQPGLPLSALVKQHVLFKEAKGGLCEVCEAARQEQEAR
ncbi:type VI secretion system tip protein VgrG, partial [Pseudomonas citronellolis]|nr:type VI secretion system tip protein VgrG [Pseudomonas citronellolis]